MKKIFKITVGATPLLMVLALFCSNPVKDVAWRTSIDLPITANKKFLLGAMMDTLFFNKNQVLTTTTYDTIKRTGKSDSIVKMVDTTMMILKAYPEYDTAAKRQISDTVAFGFPTRDTAADTISQDSLADKYYSDIFGSLPISGVPNDTFGVALAGNYTSGTRIAPPAIPVSVKYVYRVLLMDTAQSLNITVINNSNAAFGSVQIGAGSLGTSTISNLPSGSTQTVQLDARGKEIDSVMNISVAATPSASGAFAAGDSLKVVFSFNGLKASKVVAMDSLFANYQRTFSNEYNLTDTVNVNYVDIQNGFFNYIVTNYTGLDMEIAVTHRNLWTTDFSKRHNPPLLAVTDLTGLTSADSMTAYGGEVTPHTARVDFPAGQTDRFSKTNISGYRLFPEWDSATQKSVTKVDYAITVGLHGTRVTLSSGDSLTFIIHTTSFKFSEMAGTSMDAYRRVGAPTAIPVKLPWSKAVTDSLRDNFILNRVIAKTQTRIDIPNGALIDTVLIHYDITSSSDTSKRTSADAVMIHVIRDSLFQRDIDITKIVNNYPDSVKVNVTMVVPVYTKIVAENDLTNPTDPSYSKYIGRMTLNGLVNYNLVAPLCWTVADTTVMDLGGARVDMSGASGVLDPLNKMTDRHASVNLKVINFTNVDLKLFALAATDTSMIAPLVDTGNANYISTNALTQYINNPPHGFINLLGNGVWIPPRDSLTAVRDTVVLNDAQLGALAGTKKMGLRWEVRFIPRNTNGVIDTTADALYNTDWIKLNSWVHFDGVNSVDSLFK